MAGGCGLRRATSLRYYRTFFKKPLVFLNSFQKNIRMLEQEYDRHTISQLQNGTDCEEAEKKGSFSEKDERC
jgi:phage-related protein